MTGTEPLSQGLDERSLYLRRLVMRGMLGGGRGHPGSALSIIEILRALYDGFLHYRPREPGWPERDRFILSKGHGCLALYAMLADKGFFPATELDRFCRLDSMLGGHPEYGQVPGVETSTGALGHGLSVGAGMALAGRLKTSPSRVVVVMGDGEINEGAVWEAAMFSAKHRLANLIGVVDYNKLQSYGPVSEVQSMEPLADKWQAFGWAVAEVNGHDVDQLTACLARLPLQGDRPSLVIAHTIKGKGLPMAENNPDWHHKSRLQPEELAQLHQALGE